LAARTPGLTGGYGSTVFFSNAVYVPGTRLIATAPRRLARTLAPSLGLKILECPVQIPPLNQILMWHPRNDQDPAHQYLRKLLLDVAGVTPVSRATSTAPCALQVREVNRLGV
jgi:hypothetical protein